LDTLPALCANGVGATHAALASGEAESFLAVAELRGEIDRILTHWREESRFLVSSESSECSVIPSERSESRDLHLAEPVIAAACSEVTGWIAALDDGRLIASLGDHQRTAEHENNATDDVEVLLRALRLADGVQRVANDAESIAARRHVEQWIAHDWARRACAIAPYRSPGRQRTLRKLESALSSVPRHRQRSALLLASSIRAALESRLTLGIERALEELPAEEDGTRWLDRAVALLSIPSDANSPREPTEVPARARAIILLGPNLGDAAGAHPQSVPR